MIALQVENSDRKPWGPVLLVLTGWKNNKNEHIFFRFLLVYFHWVLSLLWCPWLWLPLILEKWAILIFLDFIFDGKRR